MATADSIREAPKRSLTSQLWRRWQARRRRNQARYLSQVRFRLTREGVHFLAVLLFIFVGAVIREINLLILLAGAMIGLLILQWRFNSRTLIGLTLDRRLPLHATVGQTTRVRAALANPKPWLGSWLVLVEDRLHKLSPDAKRLPEKGISIVDAVRPKGTATCMYQLEFHERGRYRIGPSVISTRFPIGLGRGWRTLDNAAELVVRPAIGQMTPRASALFQQLREGQAASSPKSGVHEADFYGLRPWQSGDSRRWIHWRTTARLGELSVRQFERQQHHQVCVLLDLYAPPGKPSELQQQAVEQAISFVATLASKTAMQGSDRLAAVIAGAEVDTFANVQSSVMISSLLDTLATVTTSPTPDVAAAIRSLMLPLINNPVLLVVSTRGNQIANLANALQDPLSSKLLARLKIKWLDASAGELEAYFSSNSNE